MNTLVNFYYINYILYKFSIFYNMFSKYIFHAYILKDFISLIVYDARPQNNFDLNSPMIINNIVAVVRRSLESWWRQPTFRRVYVAHLSPRPRAWRVLVWVTVSQPPTIWYWSDTRSTYFLCANSPSSCRSLAFVAFSANNFMKFQSSFRKQSTNLLK